MKKIKLISLFLVFLFAVVNFSYAQDLTLIFSGQTHAMLYPCSCPFEQDGGIARRSTLVKDLRKSDPGLLLLDCGSFTAGGKMDEYTKDKVLDSKRTEVNLLALQLMGYDALGITPDEFNLGEEFFSKNITLKRPAYLSANLASDKVLPYLVKETNGVKVGIIGLTNLGLGKKLVNLKVNPVQGIAELITKIKKQGAQVIIVISSLGEDEDLKLVAQVKGIDLLFVGYNPQKNEAQTKIGTTFFFRPFWQGRKLGKLTLQLKDKKLFSCQLEELRVSNKLADDPEILKILPRCYSDSNCKQKGLIGSCQNPGELRASCLFTELNKVSLLVITTRDCRVCHPEEVVGLLKQQFPGLTPEYVYLPDPLAVKLIKDFSLSSLPAYILGKEVEKDRNFDNFKNNLELKQEHSCIMPL